MARENGHNGGDERTSSTSSAGGADRPRRRAATGSGLTEYCGTVCWFLSWIAAVSAFCLIGLAVLLRDGRAGAAAAAALVLHLILLSIAQIIATLRRIEDRLG